MSSTEQPGGGAPDAGMQFDKVEQVAPTAAPSCAACHRPLDEYFELGGNMICSTCAATVKAGKGSKAFFKALLFGAGAAALGTIIWLAILSATKMELGLVAIAIGLLVGFAVRKGAGGGAGWKYQTLAMVLTYMSITFSYVPMVLKGFREAADQRDAAAATAAADDAQAQDKPTTATGAGGAPAPAAAKPEVSSAAVVVAYLFVFGFAMVLPFLAGAENIMGWIIIGIALYEAWKINRRVPVSGPFRLAAANVAAGAPPGPPAAPPAPGVA
jgi:hypothetical protein